MLNNFINHYQGKIPWVINTQHRKKIIFFVLEQRFENIFLDYQNFWNNGITYPILLEHSSILNVIFRGQLKFEKRIIMF